MKAPDVQAVKTSRRTNAILLTLLFACGAAAQVPAERKRPAQTTAAPQSPKTNQPASSQTAKPSAKSARDAKARDRRERQSAAAALNEAAAAAGGVEDLYKRTLILALAADALWPYDEQAARALLSRAWEMAVASDEEESKSAEEHYRERAAAQNPPETSGDMPEWLTRVTRARGEVLSAASRHDSRSTERYLAEMRAQNERRRGDDGVREEAERRPFDASEYYSVYGDEQTRLSLSLSLADDGEYRQAAAIAAPEIASGVSAALLRFLIQFREDAPAEADALYRRLVARVASDPRAGAKEVLLLSSYALTPALITTVDAYGSVSFIPVYTLNGERLTPAQTTPLAADVMREFFAAAVGILMRPQRAADRRAEAAALYFTVARLLPYFERGAPQFAPQLHARLQTLAAELDAQSRERLSNSAQTKSLTSSNPVDPLEDDSEYSKTGPSATARDAARSRVVRRAIELKLWGRARDAAESMEDPESRAGYLQLIAVAQVGSVAEAFEDDEDGDERAAKFVENADVPPLTRAFGYSRAAVLASKLNKLARARELLDRAQAFAEQTDSGTEARFAAMLVTATAAEEFDAARAWAAVPALVQAANEVRDAKQEDLSGGFSQPQVEGVENVGLGKTLAEFRLDSLFASLAKRDFEHALKEARALDDSTTRSLVIVAAARGRLALPPAPESKGAR